MTRARARLGVVCTGFESAPLSAVTAVTDVAADENATSNFGHVIVDLTDQRSAAEPQSGSSSRLEIWLESNIHKTASW